MEVRAPRPPGAAPPTAKARTSCCTRCMNAIPSSPSAFEAAARLVQAVSERMGLASDEQHQLQQAIAELHRCAGGQFDPKSSPTLSSPIPANSNNTVDRTTGRYVSARLDAVPGRPFLVGSSEDGV